MKEKNKDIKAQTHTPSAMRHKVRKIMVCHYDCDKCPYKEPVDCSEAK